VGVAGVALEKELACPFSLCHALLSVHENMQTWLQMTFHTVIIFKGNATSTHSSSLLVHHSLVLSNTDKLSPAQTCLKLTMSSTFVARIISDVPNAFMWSIVDGMCYTVMVIKAANVNVPESLKGKKKYMRSLIERQLLSIGNFTTIIFDLSPPAIWLYGTKDSLPFLQGI
jgi:hypothetical protein